MALGDVAGLLQPLIDTAASMSSAFVPMGRTLLALSIILALGFAVYDWWMGEAGGALARAVRAGLILTIPLFLFYGNNWTASMKTFSNFFSTELTAPIMKAAGQQSGPEAVKSAITKLSQSMFPNTRHVDDRSTWEKVRDFLMSEETLGGALFSSLTEAFFELVLFVISLFVSMALVFALYGPLLALQIGVIFGPLLLAWLPFGPLSHLSKSWFQFMLTQGFALVVGVTIAILGAGVIEDYTDQMMMMARDPSLPWYEEFAAQIGGFMASTSVIVFVGFFLFRADDIAAALIGGGGAGSSGVGAVIFSRMTGGRPGGKPPKPEPPKGGGGDK